MNLPFKDLPHVSWWNLGGMDPVKVTLSTGDVSTTVETRDAPSDRTTGRMGL